MSVIITIATYIYNHVYLLGQLLTQDYATVGISSEHYIIWESLSLPLFCENCKIYNMQHDDIIIII